MVVSVDIRHVYRYPLELVVQTHFTKYPTEREKFVHRVEVLEHKIDFAKGLDYRRRIAVCENVIPMLMRRFSALKEDKILLEEETWLNTVSGCLNIKAHNITWARFAIMREESSFVPHTENPNWTQFQQHGTVEVQGLGPLGRVLELFAKQVLYAGAKRSLWIMEEELKDRWEEKAQITS